MEEVMDFDSLNVLLSTLVNCPTEGQTFFVAEQLVASLACYHGPATEITKFFNFIIRMGYQSESLQQYLIANVLSLIANQMSTYWAAISDAITVLPNEPEPFSPVFVHGLKFINELVKFRLVDCSVFLHYARYCVATGDSDYLIPFVYEILRNYDRLIAEGMANFCDELEQYSCYLAKIFAISERITSPTLWKIVDYIQVRSLRKGHVHNEKCTLQLPVPTPIRNVGETRSKSNEELLEELRKNPNDFNSISSQIRNNLANTGCTFEWHVTNLLDLASQFNPLPLPISNLLSALFEIPPIPKFHRLERDCYRNAVKNWFKCHQPNSFEKLPLCYEKAKNDVEVEVSPTTKTPEINQTSSIDELLQLLEEQPNRLNDVATQLKIQPVDALIEGILEKSAELQSISPVFAELLNILSMASDFSDSLHEWSLRKFRCDNKITETTEILWFHAELCQLGLIPFRLYREHVNKAMLFEATDDFAQYICQMLKEVHKLVVSNTWIYDESGAAFFAAAAFYLQMVCDSENKLITSEKSSEILQSLTEIKQKGGWFRKDVSKETSETTVPADPITDFSLKGDVNRTVTSLKQALNLQLPEVFSQRVCAILDKLFAQLTEETLIEATEICAGLSEVASSSGKPFVTELQEQCLNWFTQTYRTAVEKFLLNLHREIKSAKSVEDKTSLSSNWKSATRSYANKSIECPRLIGKLFTSHCLTDSFVVSFLQTLIATKTVEVYSKMHEMLADVGKQLEFRASDGLDKCFQELVSIRSDTNCDRELKRIVKKILSLRKNGWS